MWYNRSNDWMVTTRTDKVANTHKLGLYLLSFGRFLHNMESAK